MQIGVPDMRYVKLVKVVILLVLTAVLLASCGRSRAPAPPRAEQSPTVQEQEEAPAVERDEAPEESDPGAEQEAFLASYIGKTVSDVVEDFGDEYTVDYYEGSTIITYPDGFGFLFGITVDKITDDLVIRQVIAAGQRPVVYDLTGSMTYSEIVEAVGGEANVPPQDRFFSEIYQEWEIVIEFVYREYCLVYFWEDGSEESQSSFVQAFKLDVDPIATDPAPDSSSEEAPPDAETEDPDDDGVRQELLEGPEKFEGVMGCKFNVPEGFTQQMDEGLVSGPGMYRYSFQSDQLDMNISVFECTFEALPITAADIPAEYQSASSAESVTYSASGTGYYVVSGYHGDETVYYTRVDYNEDVYTSLDFVYPTENADACEKVLLEFLKDYTAD